jgi:hypothetical protein
MNVHNFYPHNMQKVPQGTTNFRGGPGMPPELQLRRDETEIQVDSLYPQHDFRIHGDADSVTLDRSAYAFDTSFRRQGQDILIDRPGFHNDLTVHRDETSVTLDRPGVQNDVSARFSPNRIDIRHHGMHQNVSLEKHGPDVLVKQSGYLVESFPASLFPGGEGWPTQPNLLSISEHMGISERMADSLDRWSVNGIDKDDIVRVDRQGQLYTFEDEYQ